MPKKQRKLFACENRIISYRFYKGVYEAHYRRDGFKVFACAKDFNEMCKKFREKLLAQMNGEIPVICVEKAKPYRAALFRDYLKEWLEIKLKTCKPSTCKEYKRLCDYNLMPAFGEKRLDELTRPVLQKYLFDLVDAGKHRTAEKLQQILCCVFDLAVEDLNIVSPMKKIVLPYHAAKKGSALTK